MTNYQAAILAAGQMYAADPGANYYDSFGEALASVLDGMKENPEHNPPSTGPVDIPVTVLPDPNRN